jgi:hypothetical protein
VKAATIKCSGYISGNNPIYSAPYATATTWGHQHITAQLSVSKSGYDTRSCSVEKDAGLGSTVETSALYGPTYASAGTNFYSVHTGYDYYGNYEYLTASLSY